MSRRPQGSRRLALALALVLLAPLIAACGGEEGPLTIGRDPDGDLRYFGSQNPWEFMDIVEFGSRSKDGGVEGYIEFLHSPEICPSCTFTIEYELEGRVLIAEIDTHLDDVTRRELWIRYGSGAPDDRYEFVSDDFTVRESESTRRLEFVLPVTVAPGSVMRVRSFHDERGGESVKAIDLSDTPATIGPAAG
jgi:hypothetical protein